MNTDTSKPQPTLNSTPSSIWFASGESDPHRTEYDVDRGGLYLGYLTDDELANGAFINYDQVLSLPDLLNPKPGRHMPIVWMTAVKDRIRWLSRSLEKLLAERSVLGLTKDLLLKPSATAGDDDLAKGPELSDAEVNVILTRNGYTVKEVCPTCVRTSIKQSGKLIAADSKVRSTDVYEAQIKTLTAERDHWKANHDAQVERARILIDKVDLPLERVKAYEVVTKQALKATKVDVCHFYNLVVQAHIDLVAKNYDGCDARLRGITDSLVTYWGWEQEPNQELRQGQAVPAQPSPASRTPNS